MLNLIDYDRGIQKRTVDSLQVDVYMYVDTPGVYLNAHGNEISEELARKAGFPVDDHLKERKLREALSQAERQIRIEMGAVVEKQVIITRDGYTLVGIGLDRFQVFAPDGEVLTKAPLTLAEAKIVFDQLVPPDEGAVDANPTSNSDSGSKSPSTNRRAS